MHTTSFCNNHHQVHAQNRNIGKQIIKVLVAGVTKGAYNVPLYLETQFQQIVNFIKLSTVQPCRLLFYLTVTCIYPR